MLIFQLDLATACRDASQVRDPRVTIVHHLPDPVGLTAAQFPTLSFPSRECVSVGVSVISVCVYVFTAQNFREFH